MRGRKKMNDPKVTWSLKSPPDVLKEMDEEAKRRGVTRSDVANERLQHYAAPLTPELMVQLQNKANLKYEELKENQPEKAVEIQRKVMELWKLLK